MQTINSNILATIKNQILIVGDGGVGKTSLIRKYVDNKFYKSYIPTIGTDFSLKNEYINVKTKNGFGSVKVLLKIFDIGGQPEFRENMIRYTKTSDIFIICYDCTNYTSFNNIFKWVTEIKSHINFNPITQSIILIATKSDLLIDNKYYYEQKSRSFLDNQRMNYNQIPICQLQKMAEFVGSSDCFETSALSGNNIQDLFSTIAKISLKIFFIQSKNKDIVIIQNSNFI